MLQIASLKIFRILRIIMAIMVKWHGRLRRGRAEDGNYSLIWSGLTGRTELGAESYTAFLNVSKQLSAILCKKKRQKKKTKKKTKKNKNKNKTNKQKKNSCSAVCGT